MENASDVRCLISHRSNTFKNPLHFIRNTLQLIWGIIQVLLFFTWLELLGQEVRILKNYSNWFTNSERIHFHEISIHAHPSLHLLTSEINPLTIHWLFVWIVFQDANYPFVSQNLSPRVVPYSLPIYFWMEAAPLIHASNSNIDHAMIVSTDVPPMTVLLPMSMYALHIQIDMHVMRNIVSVLRFMLYKWNVYMKLSWFSVSVLRSIHFLSL